ncbi:MAG: hypothetical protein RL695_1838 [Pseudomonadota bacterium]|jgi:hypothetical protein
MNMAWHVPVVRWAVWGDGVPGEVAPDVGFVDPMLRRRLSPLARGVLHVAQRCAQGHESVRFVFASRHGELQRTVDLLGSLARDEDLSPTVFGLSVLNAAAGIFSIARGDHGAVTAIAAGVESFGYGLLEAYVQSCQDHTVPVLFVYADAPAPSPLDAQSGDPRSPFALAMLIDAAMSEHRLHVEWASLNVANHAPSHMPQAHACIAALENATSTWVGPQRLWKWTWQ